jgi:hypothetical protein
MLTRCSIVAKCYDFGQCGGGPGPLPLASLLRMRLLTPPPTFFTLHRLAQSGRKALVGLSPSIVVLCKVA